MHPFAPPLQMLALRVDDLSTPGAYWLNPPLPRDVHGNSVDPDTGLRVKARAIGVTPFGSDAAAATQRGEAEVGVEAEAEGAEAEGEAGKAGEAEEAEEALLRAALLDIDPRPTPRRAAPPRAALAVGPAAAAALLAREGGASLLDVRQPGELMPSQPSCPHPLPCLYPFLRPCPTLPLPLPLPLPYPYPCSHPHPNQVSTGWTATSTARPTYLRTREQKLPRALQRPSVHVLEAAPKPSPSPDLGPSPSQPESQPCAYSPDRKPTPHSQVGARLLLTE